MSDAVGKAMRRLAAVYGEPQTEYKTELISEFIAALSGFRGDVLTNGVDRVIRERAFPTWPTVGEVVKACRDVASELSDKYIPEKAHSAVDDREPVSQEVAANLLKMAHAGLDSRNSFACIKARAIAWSKHHGCGVIVDVSEPWGMEAVDVHGRVVPIGWRA